MVADQHDLHVSGLSDNLSGIVVNLLLRGSGSARAALHEMT